MRNIPTAAELELPFTSEFAEQWDRARELALAGQTEEHDRLRAMVDSRTYPKRTEQPDDGPRPVHKLGGPKKIKPRTWKRWLKSLIGK